MGKKRDQRGITVVAVEKPAMTKVTHFLHNVCDKTTWYQSSTRITDEVATVKVPNDYTTYELANNYIIDCNHGKLSQEDYLVTKSGDPITVVVKVNGVEKTQQDPHTGSGGDYTVDFVNGEITFLSALTAGDSVTVSYNYAINADFVISPNSGKVFSLDSVEVQFSEDFTLLDTVRFQGKGNVEDFAPHLMNPPYNYPAGTKISLGDPIVYKTMQDYYNDTRRAYTSYPALGGNGWRASSQPCYIFSWDYVRSTPLEHSKGMELHITMDNNLAFGGTSVTATFYGSEEDE